MYHISWNPGWDPKAVTVQTPYDVQAFIAQKCDEKSKGFEGKKVKLPLAILPLLSLKPFDIS